MCVCVFSSEFNADSEIVSSKNVSLKSYNHFSGDQPPVHDLFANR